MLNRSYPSTKTAAMREEGTSACNQAGFERMGGDGKIRARGVVWGSELDGEAG
jgi:hypothetical protein